jgi:hypothetical protein
MNSRVKKTRKTQLVAALMLGALTSSCAPPIVTTHPSGCSSLIPSEWKQSVEGVDPPGASGRPTVIADWQVAFDGQTGRLDQANGRTKDSIGIVERCEQRDAAAVHKATHRFLGIF